MNIPNGILISQVGLLRMERRAECHDRANGGRFS